MRLKFIVASLMLLLTICASAQRNYTGVISFPAIGVSYKIDNSDNFDTDEVDEGERYLYHLVKAAYGLSPSLYWYKIENSARSLSGIIIQPLNQALRNPLLKDLPTDMGDIVIYGKIKGSRYRATNLVADIRIIDVDHYTVFDPETGAIKKIKPFWKTN
ncbi:hypothetical protein DHW03_16310 [Pedobacter yonginense]|uniref:Uncharacterized protein n=1 Tax=Pedobacter yonginense TaxID=651869 RepID=A0A317EKG9_9SPHI|nr:hypothetical protein [Pedobacter yonginense]PWS26343.1 hypothetical protein DHW03_16310 [Pedobacter yonginense]